MKLATIKSEGIAHRSYLLTDHEEAAVIDPRRDSQTYLRQAEKTCAKIKYILETHRNEDYVTGSLELQNMTEAEIGHSKALPFKYGERHLDDGDILKVGSMKIKVLHTPGHTKESLCYVVYASANEKEALMVFTGDTLFAGSVGRTDLYGKKLHPKQASELYVSLHEKLLPLGDHVLVYPAHGAGSVCGSGISSQEPTTIGYEKKTNPYLQLDEDAFVKRALAEELIVPRYFKKMEEYNLNGPPFLSELSFPRPMSMADFEEHAKESNVLIVDTRNPYAFAGVHISGSLSIWLDGTSVYPGWVMPVDQYIIFVLERPGDIRQVAARFHRLGFDNMCGYLCQGIAEWQETGKPISSLGTLSAQQLKSKLKNGEVMLLDVREPREWKEGYVKGAERIFFGELSEKTNLLPKNKPIAVTCSVGNRSSIGASILKRKGFREVYNVLGGMTAWENLAYPTKKEYP
jgi:hydroxyacylglutathione hydrolase